MYICTYTYIRYIIYICCDDNCFYFECYILYKYIYKYIYIYIIFDALCDVKVTIEKTLSL